MTVSSIVQAARALLMLLSAEQRYPLSTAFSDQPSARGQRINQWSRLESRSLHRIRYSRATHIAAIARFLPTEPGGRWGVGQLVMTRSALRCGKSRPSVPFPAVGAQIADCRIFEKVAPRSPERKSP